MLDANKAAMEKDLADAKALKEKPATEPSPSKPVPGMTPSETWTSDMP